MQTNKIYKVNFIRLLFELLGGAIFLAALVYVLFRFQGAFSPNQKIYWVAGTVTCVIGMIVNLFFTVSKIEFEKNILKISYLLFRKKEIDFSKVKDFSVSNKFRNIGIYFIDNRKHVKVRLLYLDIFSREAICDNIAEIMKGFFEKYSDEQLYSFYQDKKQYDFSATERHIPLFVWLVSFWGFQTFCAVACVVLLLIFPPGGGIFSIIKEWYFWFLFGSWIIIFLIDFIIPKRTLTCENGIITLTRKEKVIFTFKAKDVRKYWLNYKEFIWVLKQTPQKDNVMSLMGFSRKEKRDFRNKLESLFNSA